MRTSFSIPPPPPPPVGRRRRARRVEEQDCLTEKRACVCEPEPSEESERVAECGSGPVVPVPPACASKVRVRRCAGALAEMYLVSRVLV